MFERLSDENLTAVLIWAILGLSLVASIAVWSFGRFCVLLFNGYPPEPVNKETRFTRCYHDNSLTGQCGNLDHPCRTTGECDRVIQSINDNEI